MLFWLAVAGDVIRIDVMVPIPPYYCPHCRVRIVTIGILGAFANQVIDI